MLLRRLSRRRTCVRASSSSFCAPVTACCCACMRVSKIWARSDATVAARKSWRSSRTSRSSACKVCESFAAESERELDWRVPARESSITADVNTKSTTSSTETNARRMRSLHRRTAGMRSAIRAHLPSLHGCRAAPKRCIRHCVAPLSEILRCFLCARVHSDGFVRLRQLEHAIKHPARSRHAQIAPGFFQPSERLHYLADAGAIDQAHLAQIQNHAFLLARDERLDFFINQRAIRAHQQTPADLKDRNAICLLLQTMHALSISRPRKGTAESFACNRPARQVPYRPSRKE